MADRKPQLVYITILADRMFVTDFHIVKELSVRIPILYGLILLDANRIELMSLR